MDNLYLKNLEEAVLDENKIVTYKWLSCMLQVHVNTAKQMLYSFLQIQRNEKNNSKLTCTYLISGSQIDDNGVEKIKVRIVPEDCLEKTKSSMKVLLSCHVYSVQQCKIKEANVLYQADYKLIKENSIDTNRYGGISYPNANKRDLQISITQSTEKKDSFTSIKTEKKETYTSIKTEKKEAFTAIKNPDSQDSSLQRKDTSIKPTKNNEPLSNSSDINETKKSRNNEETKKSPPKKSKNNIANMFAKAPPKKSSTPVIESQCKEEKEDKSSNHKSPIKELFIAKQSVKEKDSDVESDLMQVDDSINCDSSSKRIKDFKGDDIVDDDDDEDDIKISKKRKAEEVIDKNKSEGVKVKRSKQIISDSEDEDVIPPTPPVKMKSPKKLPHKTSKLDDVVKDDKSKVRSINKENQDTFKLDDVVKDDKSKVRSMNKENEDTSTKATKITKKLVSKTYLNDEGYMVTEKVYENEVTEIVETQVKKTEKIPSPIKKEDTKKKAPKSAAVNKGGGKQTSLMNFFKKQ